MGEPTDPPEPSPPADPAADVPRRLERALVAWEPRLREQLDDLHTKLDRSIERLAVVARAEPGRIRYQIDPTHQRALWTWLRRATRAWRTSNAAQVAAEANEALGELRDRMPAAGRFHVRPAPLDAPPWQPPALPGVSAPLAHPLGSLGLASRVLLAAALLAGLAGLAAALAARPAAGPLLWLALSVLALALAHAAATVPARHRLALARQRDQAAARALAEVRAAAREHLAQVAEHQLAVIGEHLARSEPRRWARVASGQGDGEPSGAVARPAPEMSAGAMEFPDILADERRKAAGPPA